MNIQTRIAAQLESNPDSVSPEVAAAALAEYQKQQETAQRETMIRRLSQASSCTGEAVSLLRDARKDERRAKTFVDALAAAEEAFQKDGNWKAYVKAKETATLAYRSDE